jgi:hypothetical protein
MVDTFAGYELLGISAANSEASKRMYEKTDKDCAAKVAQAKARLGPWPHACDACSKGESLKFARGWRAEPIPPWLGECFPLAGPCLFVLSSGTRSQGPGRSSIMLGGCIHVDRCQETFQS